MFKVVYVGGPEGYLAAKDELSDVADVVHVESEFGVLRGALSDADALLDASMKVPITDDMIISAPKLKIISCATTGSDHIERSCLEERNIPVRTLKEDPDLLYNITPAAELSWALLMACARKLVSSVKHVCSNQWVREEFPGIMLNGRQLGLVGCGRIGQWMARYANAFGMKVVGYDPFLDEFPENLKQVSLEELFETSDFVSIHVHLSNETKGLVSRELFNKARRGFILINTSRGQIVDQDAFLEALETGRLGGLGLMC